MSDCHLLLDITWDREEARRAAWCALRRFCAMTSGAPALVSDLSGRRAVGAFVTARCSLIFHSLGFWSSGEGERLSHGSDGWNKWNHDGEMTLRWGVCGVVKINRAKMFTSVVLWQPSNVVECKSRIQDQVVVRSTG